MWTNHPLTNLQRFVQGINILAKYSKYGDVKDSRNNEEIYVSISTFDDFTKQDRELLAYLNWRIGDKFGPFTIDGKEVFEYHVFFNGSNTRWVD